MPQVKRPVLRYYGGKWKLAPWIMRYFPTHKVYVEPFGGGGSVLLQKQRSNGEVYNDLDERVVTLFKVLRDPDLSEQLIEKLKLTPFSRREFERAKSHLVSCDAIEKCTSLIVLSFMSHGSSWHRNATTGFRGSARNEYGVNSATDWVRYPDELRQIVLRLRGVLLECRPAIDVIAQHDGLDVLFYVDPPYLSRLRGRRQKTAYAFEMSVNDHVDLLTRLRDVKGMVVLSGMTDPLYNEILCDWYRADTEHIGDKGKRMIESIWLNPLCYERQPQLCLFGGM